MSPQITITDASGFLANSAHLVSCRTFVRYLGPSYETLLRLQGCLSEGGAVHPGGQALKVISHRIEDQIVNIDTQLWPHEDRTLWDASAIAERSAAVIPLQRMIAGVLLMLEDVREADDVVFIVETRDDARALWDCAKMAGLSAHLYPGAVVLEPIVRAVIDVVRGVRHQAAALYHLARCQLIVSRIRRYANKPKPSLAGVDTIIFTWGTKNMFSADVPVQTIPYLGRLPSVIANAGLKRAFVCTSVGRSTRAYSEIANNIISADEKSLMFEECVTLRSAVRALFLSLSFFWRVRRHFIAEGRDVGPIISLALSQERRSGRIVEALLRRGVAGKLRRLEANPKSIICVYENQPWEKNLRIGLRAHFPKSSIIGAIFCHFSENQLSLYPSRTDVKSGRMPDILMVTCKMARNAFIAHGLPSERVLVGGALRSGMSISAQRMSKINDAPERIILCCGNTWFDTTMELVIKSVIATQGLNGVRLVVNMHPMVTAEFYERIQAGVARHAHGDTSHVTFSDQGVDSLLGVGALVLYGQSGSVFNALAQGIPVVYVANETDLDYDKLPWNVGIPRPQSIDELRLVICDWLGDETSASLSPSALNTLDEMTHAPFDEKVWRKVITSTATLASTS